VEENKTDRKIVLEALLDEIFRICGNGPHPTITTLDSRSQTKAGEG
jgi:hypothetical protein